MDSSFLTFSPKALSKKKLGNIVQGPVKCRILRSKICPLQDARCSPSSFHNVEKNRRESTESKKSSSQMLDDSVVIISEKINSRSTSHVPKFFSTEKKSPASTLIAKNVKSGRVEGMGNDKFDEIRNWLNELHTAHERKRFSPPWSSSNLSSVIECSPVSDDPPKFDTQNTFRNRISETSSDESLRSKQQKDSVGSDYICSSQEFEKNNNCKGVIPESSDDESEIHVRRKKACLIFSDSECEDGNSNRSQSSSVGKKSDLISKKSDKDSKLLIPCSKSNSDLSQSSLVKKKTDSVSKKSSEDSFKLSLPRSRCKNLDLISNKSSEDSLKLSLPRSNYDDGSCSRTSSQSDESIISVNSVDRIISNLYVENWNKESVLTPVVQKRKPVTKKQSSEVDSVSAAATLSQLYGKNWDEKTLTPLLNRRKVRKGKENTPPVNQKEVNDVRPFLTPKTQVPIHGISAPKTCPSRKGISKNTQSFETLSFLRSLSACSPKKSNPEALLYKKEFKKKKGELCTRLFKLFNAEVFENKLPCNLKIDWNVRMSRTAGFCFNSSVLGSQGKVRSSRIQLSTKVCNTADRVRDTLIHELCHAAAWIIDGVKNGHGTYWKAWTKKATTRFPDLPRIGRCHSYSIETKYTYKCKNCGYSFGRHSKSLDLQRKRCGYCYGEFDLLVNTKPQTTKNASSEVQSTPKAPRAATGFALYVKENYKITKEKNSGLKHADIMKLLGSQFSGMKIGPTQEV